MSITSISRRGISRREMRDRVVGEGLRFLDEGRHLPLILGEGAGVILGLCEFVREDVGAGDGHPRPEA